MEALKPSLNKSNKFQSIHLDDPINISINNTLYSKSTTKEIPICFTSKERIPKERDYIGSYKIPGEYLRKRTNPTEELIKKKEEKIEENNEEKNDEEKIKETKNDNDNNIEIEKKEENKEDEKKEDNVEEKKDEIKIENKDNINRNKENAALMVFIGNISNLNDYLSNQSKIKKIFSHFDEIFKFSEENIKKVSDILGFNIK